MCASRSKSTLLRSGLVSMGMWAWISLDSRAADGIAGKTAATLQEQRALGQRIFSHEWVVDDRNSHGGDGLGPVFNDRSCVACHIQGGTGGGGSARKNVDVLTASVTPIPPSNPASAPASTSPVDTRPVDRRELAAIHPGFEFAESVVLHRFGMSPAYATWRKTLLSPARPESETNAGPASAAQTTAEPAELPKRIESGQFTLLRTERNPTSLFGAGLIDGIADREIEAAARTTRPAFPKVKGRVSRTKDGRIGRFGWKAQIPSLKDFVLTACAVELGLEVPGHHQAGDPLGYGDRVEGLDLAESECNALVAYVQSLPAPIVSWRTSPAGKQIFEKIGCAACHTPKLGGVESLYSDLLLHDMGEELQDTGGYGAFTPLSPGDVINGPAGQPVADAGPGTARSPGEQEAKPAFGAGRLEWRTPPLWGVGDSAPYLHDGRATTLDEAIRLHGGEAEASKSSYHRLPALEKLHLLKFLASLKAPSQRDPGLRAARGRYVVGDSAEGSR
jgi:CxxC motif-containing protein (DUF1111 family)